MLPLEPSRWVPSILEVRMAPEHAVLAALDISLQLATVSLTAENPGTRAYRPAIDAPDSTPQAPLATRILEAASHLRQLIACYRVHRLAFDQMLAVAADDEADEDIPF